MSFILLNSGQATGTEYDVNVSDSISVSDAAATSVAFLRTGTDSVSVTDSTTAGLIKTASISDTVSTSDSVSTAKISTIVIGDSVITTELLSIIGGLTLEIDESISVVDHVTASLVGPDVPISTTTPGLSLALLKSLLTPAMQRRHTSQGSFASDMAKAYDQFARLAKPTPVTTGRRQIFESTLRGSLASAGFNKTQGLSTIVKAITAYWPGVPVAGGGVVTGFLGGSVTVMAMADRFGQTSLSAPEATQRLAEIMFAATLMVQYVIMGVPAFLL